jgi:hypothetical protein
LIFVQHLNIKVCTSEAHIWPMKVDFFVYKVICASTLSDLLR